MHSSTAERTSSLTRRTQSEEPRASGTHTRAGRIDLAARVLTMRTCACVCACVRGMGDDEAFFAAHAEDIEAKLRQAKALREELTRAERQRAELSRQVCVSSRTCPSPRTCLSPLSPFACLLMAPDGCVCRAVSSGSSHSSLSPLASLLVAVFRAL